MDNDNKALKALEKAVEVLGDEKTAIHWMMKEIPSLGNERPIRLINSAEGAARVMEVLSRIEYGVW